MLDCGNFIRILAAGKWAVSDKSSLWTLLIIACQYFHLAGVLHACHTSAPSLAWTLHDSVSHIMSIVCFKLSSIEIFSALHLCSSIFLPKAMRNRISDPRRFEEISCACWLSLWLQRIAFPRSQTNLLHLLLCPHQNLKKHENPWLPNPLNLWKHKHPKLSVSPTIGLLNSSVITLLHAVDNPPAAPAPGILISQGPTHFRTSW